jgi:tripartite-type tricarboxylate transporter receptor subunit TctC
MGTPGTHGINVNLYRKLSWHSLRSFAPISLVAMVPNIMVINNDVPVKNVKEMIAYAKANPGKINYGSPGNGSTAHLSMELFKTMTGTNMVHIPYKGSAGVLADVMGGQISVTIDNMPVYPPQVRREDPRTRGKPREALFDCARTSHHCRVRRAGL